MRRVIGVFVVLASTAAAQTIEVRKVGMLVDRDGRGFTRAPMSLVPVGRHFAMTEMNELPLVVDSAGRLVKRFAKGTGPGEFETNAYPARVGGGDTLYIGNHSSVVMFDRNLKFLGTVTPRGISVVDFIPVAGQFVFSSGRPLEKNTITSLHVTDRSGVIIRSFLVDTLPVPRRWPGPQYSIARGSGNTVWAWPLQDHSLQRWSLDGQRLMVIDTTPAWYPQKDELYKSRIHGVREVDGVLWVFSSVPVPNARAISAAAFKGKGETDARIVPFEQQSTAWLEAFDLRTGKQLAELHLKKFGVGFLDDRHFVVYSTSANDTAQLEIWEIRLKR